MAAKSETGDDRQVGLVDCLAILYLASPIVVFCIFWLLPWVAVAAVGLLCLALYEPIWSYVRGLFLGDSVRETMGGKIVVVGVIAALLTIYIGGNPINGYLNWFDWKKHIAIYNALTEASSWPVSVEVNEGDYSTPILRYSIAWYLVPAFFQTYLKFPQSILPLQLWTFVGLAIVATYMFLRMRSVYWAILALALIFCIGGWDIIGFQLFRQSHIEIGLHIERWLKFYPTIDWAGRATMAAPIVHLGWAPQHLVPALISTFLLLRAQKSLRLLRCYPAVIAILPLWSPFVAVGLVPLFLLIFFQRIRASGINASINLVSILSVLPIGLVVSAWLVSDAGNVPIAFNVGDLGALSRYLAFVALEIGPALLVIWLMGALDLNDRLFLLSLGTILFICLFRVGSAQDLIMRATIPSLLIISLRLVEGLRTYFLTLSTRPHKHWQVPAVALVLALGCVSAFQEVSRTIMNSHIDTLSRPKPTLTHLRYEFYPQYFANPDKLIFRDLFK